MNSNSQGLESLDSSGRFRMSHELEVGVKVQVPAALVTVCQPLLDLGDRVCGQVVQHGEHAQTAGHRGIGLFDELEHVGPGVALVQSGQDFTGAVFFAANQSMVPLRW